jgi:cyclophilin family peptidyl-prolyl cis-trans isomerase
MTRLSGTVVARVATLAIAIPALVAACSGGGGGAAVPTVPPATPAPSVEAGASASPTDAGSPVAGIPADCPTSQPEALPAGEKRVVTIATDQGDIEIELDASLSPIAVGNFVALAECGFYDGVVFHRVVPGFVIQGGDGQYGRSPNLDPNRVGTGGPPYTIKDEPVTTTYGRGTVAMARTPQPDSVGSQFFIVLDDAAESSLASANTYQIIGTVTSGMETVDAIAAAADAELPSSPVVMNDVSVATP